MIPRHNRDVVHWILQKEGWPKYTNRAADLGGPTKGGVTLKTLQGWRRRSDPKAVVTAEDVRRLSEVEAHRIYRTLYIEEPGYAGIEDHLLRLQVVDCGVLHGPRRATLWLQSIVGVTMDGDCGPITRGAVNAADPHRIGLLLAGMRIRFLGRIIAANARARAAGRVAQSKDQGLNASGWLNRATEFITLESERCNT